MPRHVFPALGTEVEAIVEAEDESAAVRALVAVEAEFEWLETILSRFRPDSALSRLNRDGRIDGVPDLAQVVDLALAARRQTQRRFDPTVHDALVAAGYDRTFEEVRDGPRDAAARARACGGGVRVDGDRIELDPGVRVDLGGIGKGYAAERAADLLAPHGPALVNAGGDVAVRGRPRAGSWAIGLDAPGEPLTLGLAAGGLATSGRDRRRWQVAGEERHHLIDPATGRPARSPYLRVTVAAPTAVDAEVLAKDVFLGRDPSDLDAVLVAEDGAVTLTGALA